MVEHFVINKGFYRESNRRYADCLGQFNSKKEADKFIRQHYREYNHSILVLARQVT